MQLQREEEFSPIDGPHLPIIFPLSPFGFSGILIYILRCEYNG